MSDDVRQSSDFASPLNGQKIVLIVTGGIAAYKCATLVRDIRRNGGDVQVVMTPAATKFIAPLTFATLSGNPVLVELFPDPDPTEPIHLISQENCGLMVIAPASADFIGRMANGLANDLASTIALAFRGQILLAPAMNGKMWRNPIVQANLKRLTDLGVMTVGPEQGAMAGVSEPSGMGRMSEPEEILRRMESILSPNPHEQPYAGKTVLVTSGPTREPIDPVRFISNRSSGVMGDSIAVAARHLGARVVLIRGIGATASPPDNVEIVTVETAADMAEQVKLRFPQADMLVMAAAVSDWTVTRAPAKLKKSSGSPDLLFAETEDILKWAGEHKEHRITIGFALETNDHLDEARRKLAYKNADLIVLNDPTQPDSAFGGSTTQLTLLFADGTIEPLPVRSKLSAADYLLKAAYRHSVA